MLSTWEERPSPVLASRYFIVLEIQFWLFACFTRSSEKDEEFGKDCKKMMLAVERNYWGKLD